MAHQTIPVVEMKTKPLTQLNTFLQVQQPEQPQVRIHAVGNRKVGMGHVVRCSNLANALINRFAVEFDRDLIEPEALKKIASHLDRRVSFTSGKDKISHPDQDDKLVEIFDSYEFNANTFASAKKRKSLVIIIEDNPGVYMHCDMLICHGPHAKAEMFEVDKRCRLILGPENALINPCFYTLKAKAGEDVDRLFIFLGGGDASQLTTDLIADLLSIKPNLKIEAILPRVNSSKKSLASIHRDNVTFHDHTNQEKLFQLMINCDAAVVAGGSICLETTAVGLPSLLVTVADNQVLPCEAMNNLELTLYAKNIFKKNSPERRDSLMILRQFLSDSSIRARLIKNCGITFRKSGAETVSQNIEQLVIDQRL